MFFTCCLGDNDAQRGHSYLSVREARSGARHSWRAPRRADLCDGAASANGWSVYQRRSRISSDTGRRIMPPRLGKGPCSCTGRKVRPRPSAPSIDGEKLAREWRGVVRPTAFRSRTRARMLGSSAASLGARAVGPARLPRLAFSGVSIGQRSQDHRAPRSSAPGSPAHRPEPLDQLLVVGRGYPDLRAARTRQPSRRGCITSRTSTRSPIIPADHPIAIVPRDVTPEPGSGDRRSHQRLLAQQVASPSDLGDDTLGRHRIAFPQVALHAPQARQCARREGEVSHAAERTPRSRPGRPPRTAPPRSRAAAPSPRA